MLDTYGMLPFCSAQSHLTMPVSACRQHTLSLVSAGEVAALALETKNVCQQLHPKGQAVGLLTLS